MRHRLSLLGVLLAGASSLWACGDDTTSSGGGGSGGGQEGGAGGGEGGSPPGQTVKILNWNLHNFFDTTEDTTNTEDDSISQAEYSEKLGAIVDILAELDPDVMVFQEVENEAILVDIEEGLGQSYPGKFILQGNDPRGVDIAAMSRIQFDDVVSHLSETFTVEGGTDEFAWTRDLVEYHFTAGNQPVVLLGVHYKAKGPPDNPEKRLAEAQRTRAIADALVEQDSTRGILVLGDFNDLPGSPPLLAVIGSDPAYVSIADEIPSTDRWTFNFEGSLELIDHQIANPVMAGLLVTGSATIRHGADVDLASDHAPLMATYLVE